LKSATRWQPVNGGLGETPRPTVKVRMRGNAGTFFLRFLSALD
ncbi:MAG: hypothetical protein RJB54_609, partial [Actinomycetota bacterium]